MAPRRSGRSPLESRLLKGVTTANFPRDSARKSGSTSSAGRHYREFSQADRGHIFIDFSLILEAFWYFWGVRGAPWDQDLIFR